MINFSSILTPRNFTRIILLLVVLIYLVFITCQLVTGNEPFPFAAYILVYLFLLVQIPILIILTMIFISSKIKRNHLKVRIEFSLLLLSFITLALYIFCSY